MSRYWSASRGEWQELSEMNHVHLRNAFRKFSRGEYLVESGDPPDGVEAEMLRGAFAAEFERRGLDHEGNEVLPETPPGA